RVRGRGARGGRAVRRGGRLAARPPGGGSVPGARPGEPPVPGRLPGQQRDLGAGGGGVHGRPGDPPDPAAGPPPARRTGRQDDQALAGPRPGRSRRRPRHHGRRAGLDDLQLRVLVAGRRRQLRRRGRRGHPDQHLGAGGRPAARHALMFDMHVEYARPVGSTQKFGDVAVDVHDDHVAVTEIGRPPDNYFDAHLISSLADAYEWAEAQAGARAIVLCSAGKHFCAGADFTGRSTDSGAQQASAGNYAGDLYAQAARLFRARLPVVAAVQGAAVGGGLGLACSADFRVASPAARFSANFARLGLHQGFGLSVTLPAIVGQQHANLMLYTGRRVKGEEAARIGLADLLAAAYGLAAEIAAAAPLAVRSIRSTQRAGLADRVTAAMAAELAEQDQLRRTADFAEGVRASAERRPPRFEGR